MNKAFCGLTLKSAGAGDGKPMAFSGYGAVFGNVDSYGDVIEPGAFAKSLEGIKGGGSWPPMLLQHGGMIPSSADMTPVGVWTEIKEDEHGLWVEGALADTERGRELYTLLKMAPRPAINGLSIGYIPVKFEDERKGKETIRHLTEIKLIELSLVTFPANGEARIEQVKQSGLTIRDAERALREAGFSRSRAKDILSGGYKSSSLRDAGEAEDTEGAIAALLRRNISIFKGDK